MAKGHVWWIGLLTIAATLLAASFLYAAPPKKPPVRPPPKPSATPSVTTTATATEAPTTTAPPSASSSAPPADTQAKKDEAKARFEKGMTLFDKKIWDAALAEFLESRAAYPTRSNTQNAAICLRNLNRFDEALDMFETLIKDFPNLPPSDRQAVDKEVKELEALVGTIEIRAREDGAQITIDGRERGRTPATPIRVGAGSHVVRVFKEGFAPVEKRLEVASRQNVVFEARFDTLTQSGRLSVVEDGNRPAEVLVDNIVVGKAPWQGLVAIGDHVVFLRGEGNLGTQPASATVRINQVTPIVLALEPLECPVRVEATPSGAVVAVDGVAVGAGVWDGRLRKGRHKIEVAQNGFLPQERVLDLTPGKSERLAVGLERDPNSPLWRAENPAKVFIELAPSFPLGIVLGGDVAATGSSGFPVGVLGRVHGGYELRSGLGFGIGAGYMYITRDIAGRPETLRPVGKPESRGTASDTLSLRGLLVGGSAQFHRGETLTLLARLGIGAFFANAVDQRSGQFTPSGGAPLDVPTARTAADVSYLYVAPEIRLGYRLASHVEINGGLDAMLMVALSEARWNRQNGVVLGNQGFAAYDEATLFGSTLFLLNPGVGARFDF